MTRSITWNSLFQQGSSVEVYSRAEVNQLLNQLRLELMYLVTATEHGLMRSQDYLKLQGIEAEANKYVHPTSDGYKHIPAILSGDVGKFLKAESLGSFEWGTLNINWSEITGKPTTFTPVDHNHSADKITSGVFDVSLIPILNQSTTGNAATATRLETSKNINGTGFTGLSGITTKLWGTSRNITIGNTLKSVDGGVAYNWTLTEIGVPSLTGSGASGIWGISITGNAGTASTVNWFGITNTPSTYPPEVHAHTWASITNKPTGNDALVSVLEAEQIMDAVIADADLNSLWDVNVASSSIGHYLKLTDTGSPTNPTEWRSAYIQWDEIENKPTIYGPSHQWSGTSLQFTNPNGTWGSLVNLQGPQGIQGIQGLTGAMGLAGTTTWAGITDKPTTFAPSTHSHTVATTVADGFMSAANLIKLNGIATNANNYTHPTGDGNLHVLPTGTTNYTKVLKAGSTAGSLSWGFVDWSEIAEKPTTYPAENISITNIGNTLVQRDIYGDIKCRLIRGEYTPTSEGNFQHIMVQRTPGVDTDNYVRSATLAEFRSTVTDGIYLPIAGKATDSNLLDGLDSTSFVRRDTTTWIDATTIWRTGNNIWLGSIGEHRMFFDGSNSFYDNHAGHVLYRNLAHGGFHYFQSENSLGENQALAYFGNGLVHLYGNGTENIRCDSTETISYKNLKITNATPLLKLEDTNVNHADFWIYVDGNVFHILTDRDSNGIGEVPHPLYLNNTDSTGVLYGKKIVNSNNLICIDDNADSVLANLVNNGNVHITAKTSTGLEHVCATFTGSGGQYLNYTSDVKLITTSTGITVDGSVATTSDPTLKYNIQTLENSLQLVNQMRFTKFNWIATGKEDVGVDLNTLPYVLNCLTDQVENTVKNTRIRTFEYANFSAVVGSAVQELYKIVENLKVKITDLESKFTVDPV